MGTGNCSSHGHHAERPPNYLELVKLTSFPGVAATVFVKGFRTVANFAKVRPNEEMVICATKSKRSLQVIIGKNVL